MLLHILKSKSISRILFSIGWVVQGNYTVKMKTELPEQILENMKLYYTELLHNIPIADHKRNFKSNRLRHNVNQ